MELRRWLDLFPDLSERKKKELERLAAYERAMNDSDLRDWIKEITERLRKAEDKLEKSRNSYEAVVLLLRVLIERSQHARDRLPKDFMEQVELISQVLGPREQGP